MRKKPRPNSSSPSLVLGLLAALGVVGFGALLAYVLSGPPRTVPVDQRRATEAPVAADGGTPAPSSGKEKVDVLTPRYENGDLRFERQPAAPPSGVDPYVFAVNSFLDRTRFVPRKARLVRAERRGSLLRLHFSPEFDTTYGTEDEETLLNGILAAVGQFPEIEEVQFLIGERPMETLGNVDLSGPLRVRRP